MSACSTSFQCSVPFLGLIIDLLSFAGQKAVELWVLHRNVFKHASARAHMGCRAKAQTLHTQASFGLSFHQMKVSPLHSFPQILDNLTCIWGKPTHQHVKGGAPETFLGVCIIKHISMSPCEVDYLDSLCR